MNNCTFLGKLYGDVYHTKENNVDFVSFKLEVESFRKNKNGKKSRSVSILEFEAWHTAAITISEKLTSEDLILVECSARNMVNSAVPGCYFRINSFKIFNKQKYSQILED
jgi:single-stranded DNA-binding protein